MAEKNSRGRPPVMTPETVQKLEDAFRWGCTDIEACLHADISRSTLYSYCQEHPDFSDRKEDLKNAPTLRAKEVISESLKGADADVKTAQWVIEKKEGKAKQAVDLDANVKGDLSITSALELGRARAANRDKPED